MAMMKTLLPLIVALTLVSATVPGESDRDRKFMLDWYDTAKHPRIRFSRNVMDHFVGFSKTDHGSSRQGRAAPSRVIRALEGQLPQNYKVDFRLMTKAEWRDFCEAVQMVMEKKVNDSNYPNATWFDLFAANHRSAVAPSAHANAGFMAWHPCYVHGFEQLLRTEGGKPNLVMPFYDSRPDTEIPSHCDSSIYTNESIGNNQGVVANGPWKYHKVFPQDCQISTTNPYLSRACNVGCTDCMTTYAEFNTYSNTSPFRVYADYVNPFNPSYESNHNSLHVGNGGQLNIVSCASNDPFFYIMHGFVHSMFDIRMDALYTQDVQNNLTYPNGSGVNNVSRPYDKALPFNLTHQECLREAMMRDMQYIRVPPTCSADADCNHRGDQNAYWCRPQTSRCAAKIRIGGSCGKGRSIYPNKACYKEEFCSSDPICDRGVCSCISATGAVVNRPPVA